MRAAALLAIFMTWAGQAARAQSAMKLTLAEAHKLAIQNHPRLSAARFNAQAAEQIPAEIGSVLQPNFFGSVTGVGADSGTRIAAGGLNNPVIYNRLGSGLTMSQLITDFGRTGNLVQSSKLHAQAQEQVTETTRAEILLETDRAYFAVQRAQSVLTVAQQTVSARQLVADQVTALANSNLKSQLDVSFANVNLSDAKLLFVQAQNDLDARMAELATALGLPAQTYYALAEEPIPDPLPDNVRPLLDEAIQQRPELANLRLEQQASQRFEQAERALAFPSLSLIGTTGLAPAGQEAISNHFGAVGVNVTVPLFNGGLFKARRSEAEFRTRAAAQNIRDLENRIVRDVRVSYLDARTAYERVGLTAQLLDQAKLALDLSQSRYDLGLSSIIELSQAQLNLTAAQIANASAKYDYQISRSRLDFQIGDLR